MNRSAPSLRPSVWLAVLGVFVLLGLLTTAQLWVGIVTEGPGGVGLDLSLPRLAAWQVGQWIGWGLLAPIVLALAARWRLPTRRPAPWALHLAASLLAAAAHTAFATWLLRLTVPFGPIDPRSFADHYVGRLSSVLHVDLLVYAAIVAAGSAIVSYRGLRDRELLAARLETELARARLEALADQLRPHFLFNSLHGVAGLIRDGRPGDAIDTIEALSDLLRYSLQTRDTPKVPLGEEIAVAERYLEIQRVRFGDRLSVDVDVEPGLDSALVPPLLLQPLLENAVRHGVAAASGPCLIRVSASETAQGERLRIEVLDDSSGAEPGGEPTEGGGVGLASTRARLERLYPGEHRLALEPVTGAGTVARVELPLEREPGDAGKEAP